MGHEKFAIFDRNLIVDWTKRYAHSWRGPLTGIHFILSRVKIADDKLPMTLSDVWRSNQLRICPDRIQSISTTIQRRPITEDANYNDRKLCVSFISTLLFALKTVEGHSRSHKLLRGYLVDGTWLEALVTTVCPEKRDQKYFLHIFNKFARITIIFGKQHHECTGKLLVKQMPTSPIDSF